MKSCIALLFFAFISLSISAQTASLTGNVKLPDGTPVSFATVVVKEQNKHCMTDDNGYFELTGLSFKKHQLEVVSLEIQNKSFQIDFKRSGQHIDLEVQPGSVLVDQVVVTGVSAKKKMQTSGLAVDVVETQELAVQSVQTNELLDRTAGVRIRQDGGLGSRTQYNINGFSGNAVKVFIDGVPARNYGSSFSLSSIPPAMIERIEVFKGVIPGYLAEDALGGAINVVLKKRRKNSLTTSYSFGSFNTHQWNASGTFRNDKGLTVEASGFFNYSDNDYKVWGDDIYFKKYDGTIIESNGKKVKRFNDAYRSAGGKFGIGFTDVKWADQFIIGGVISKDYKEIQHGSTMAVVYGNRHYRRQANVLTLNYDKRNFLTEGLSVKMEASYSDLERQNIDTIGVRYDWAGPILKEDGSPVVNTGGAEASKEKTAAINDEKTYMVRANLSYRLHDNHYVYANYLFNDFRRENSDEFQPKAQQMLLDTRDLQKHAFTFSYESAFFSERLRTGLFYKHYIQNVTLKQPSINSETLEYQVETTKLDMDESGYGITMSYAILPNLYLLASGERALRLPNENELFGNSTLDVVATPDLKPEESWNANLGFNFSHAFGLHSFGINASVYYRDTKNMIREMFARNEEYSAYANLESVETKGIDAEFHYNYGDKLNFRFNVSRFDILFNTKYNIEGHVYNYYRTQIPNEPSFKFNGNLAYSFNDIFLKKSRLTAYYNVNYVKGFRRTWSNVGSANLKKIPTQHPMDIGLTYVFPGNKITLNLDAKNILNQQVYDNYGLQKPGRAFYIKLTYVII